LYFFLDNLTQDSFFGKRRGKGNFNGLKKKREFLDFLLRFLIGINFSSQYELKKEFLSFLFIL